MCIMFKITENVWAAVKTKVSPPDAAVSPGSYMSDLNILKLPYLPGNWTAKVGIGRVLSPPSPPPL